MHLGILSDSHSNLKSVRQAIRLLESLEIKTVLHCGDIADAETVRAFAGLETYFVFGNVDSARDVLRTTIEQIGGACCGEFGRMEFGGREIAFLHGDDARRLRDEEQSDRYDLLCYGHTHRAESHTTGRTLVLNPGALHRARPHTLAIYDPRTSRADILPV